MELAGRKALLTGATGGLGRAIAAALVGRGASLLLSGRSREALEALAAELPGEGHAALPADLAEPGAAERLAADAGEVDVLVANAGLPGAAWLSEYAPEEVTRAMVERGSGHLVFISSLNGKAATPRTSIYCATKFGLRGFALALRADLGPKGVGVSLVSPGFIRDAGMFAEAGAKPPPGMGTTSPERVGRDVVRAIERDKVELVPATVQQRVMSHLALASPGIAVRVQSGRTGQKAAKEIASAISAAHPPEKR
jgi:short-subunit dehydrogenase